MLDSFDACETERSILLLAVVQLGLPFIMIKLGWWERSRVFSMVQETFWVSRLTRLLTNSCWLFGGELCFSRVSADDGGGCFILAESHDKSIFRVWTHFHQLRIFVYDNNSWADTLLYNHQLHKMIKNTNYHLLLFENPILDKN